MLCAALTAAEAPAWAPLLGGGWGAAAAKERVVPNPADAEEAEMQRLSLHARLAAVAEAAVRVRPGARRCGAGMAMIVAETLRDAGAFEAGAFEASRETFPAGQTERIAISANDDSLNARLGKNDCLWSKAKLVSALESDERCARATTTTARSRGSNATSAGACAARNRPGSRPSGTSRAA